MKAIIISDSDARALLYKLELTALKSDNIMRENPGGILTVSEMHRAFHYVVTSWLQEQGADCVRR
jgi:hypothetical protein